MGKIKHAVKYIRVIQYFYNLLYSDSGVKNIQCDYCSSHVWLYADDTCVSIVEMVSDLLLLSSRVTEIRAEEQENKKAQKGG